MYKLYSHTDGGLYTFMPHNNYNCCSLMKKQFGNKLNVWLCLPYYICSMQDIDNQYLTTCNSLWNTSCIVHIFMFNLYNLFLLQFIVFMVTVQLMNNFSSVSTSLLCDIGMSRSSICFLNYQVSVILTCTVLPSNTFLQNSFLLLILFTFFVLFYAIISHCMP